MRAEVRAVLGGQPRSPACLLLAEGRPSGGEQHQAEWKAEEQSEGEPRLSSGAAVLVREDLPQDADRKEGEEDAQA